MHRRTLMGAAPAVLATPALAQSQSNIRLVVANSPGGGTDQIARLLAPQMQSRLGANAVVVENRSGASGVIGADLVAKSRPDGNTLLVTAAIFAITGTQPNLPYDIRRDFAPISLLAMLPTLLVVHPNFPARTFQEFVDYARAHPGRVTYASLGAASTQTLAGGLMKLRLGIELTNVPYREAGPQMVELMAGQVDASFNNITTTLSAVQSGRLRPLAVALDERWPALPDVPTFKELGMPELQASSWVALLAPAGTPAPLLARYAAIARDAVALPEVRSRILEGGGLPVGGSPEEARRFISSEIDSWGEVIRTTGVRLD
ncbi:tripartite tricarboxylate transporter substrate binding protein [Roseococcus sp. SYP-B2431]|uniref:Bug family tripartite tricarboxylate transporter substrate binding protein n=1 Tax=Roseococcus sp. SYP-B2431 TaxID=2496640 RepID=UPI00103E42FC|nr:tripartite tricarboxylate transporter substrate binding protein [Roseococcus sp. SYP-B2431]TCH99743.1 tripartite tricarboxylate transporter substrate binding protein [Roseococcus sp. SYP-B2431]